MSPSAMPPLLPMAQKRPFEDDSLDASGIQPTTEAGGCAKLLPHSPNSSESSAKQTLSSLPNATSRQHSPTTSTTSSVLSLHSKTPSLMQSPSAPPAKKRKLTFQEKQEQQRLQQEAKDARKHEKELKQAEHDSKKAAKDDERRRKNEEAEEKKRLREIEKETKRQRREAEQRQKDERKRVKEDEKRREEEEKLKKERAQSRMTNFFTKPKTPSKPQEQTAELSFASPCRLNPAKRTDSPVAKGVSSGSTDYERTFLPFHIKKDVVLAEARTNSLVTEATEARFDQYAASSNSAPISIASVWDTVTLQGRPRGFVPPRTIHVMEQLEGSCGPTDQPGRTGKPVNPMQQLKLIPMKYLEFHEDVRPPYVGTNTQIRTMNELREMARNPAKRARQTLDYDYDSEAEWEEPEEGEDLVSEGDSDSESEFPQEEMDDFLDDEDGETQRPKKRLLHGDLTPVSSGLCFEDSAGSLDHVEGVSLHELRLEPLIESVSFPLNPLKYPGTSPDAGTAPAQMPAQPFLLPTSAKPRAGHLGAKVLLEGSELARFQKYVVEEGCGMAKVPLLGMLKREFPRITNNVLKDTLETYAVSSSKRGLNKTWEIVESKP